MRAAFDLASDDVRDRRRRLMDEIFAAADDALEEQAFLTGPEPSYVDIGFCSLVAPLLASSIVFAQPSRYANGRFASFSGAFERLAAGEWPREPNPNPNPTPTPNPNPNPNPTLNPTPNPNPSRRVAARADGV